MGSKEKNFISAVIYVHNAQEHIGSFLKNIIQVLEKYFEHSEIICVDDDSDDHSVLAIREAGSRVETVSISVLHMSYFHGTEAAMGAGTDLAIGDFVLEFDTTHQDFTNETVMEVYRKSLEGYDIVSASPLCRQKMASRMFYRMLNRAVHYSYEIQTERFRILSRRALNRIGSMNRTIPYRKAVYAGCGLQMSGIRYEPTVRIRNGTDKTEKKYRWNLAADTLILFTQTGYKIAFLMTMMMMCVAVFMAVYSVIIYITSTPVAGWMTTILFMSVAFFGLFGILTVMIKYLQILVNLVFRKKDYNFETIEKLTR